MSMRDAEQEDFGNKNVCTSMAGQLRCANTGAEVVVSLELRLEQ
jgi:hypothetical protein